MPLKIGTPTKAQLAATFAGKPAPSGITVTKRYVPELQQYNISPSSLRRWRSAMARQRSGGAAARLHCMGDSITWGYQQSDPLETKSYPARLRSIMGSSNLFGGVYEGPIWLSYVQSGPATKTDSRFTIGSGWGLNGNGLGPASKTGYVNTTTTNTITFGPVTCDSFTVYYIRSTASPNLNNFTWSVDGGTATTVNSNNGTNGFGSVTFSAGALGSHTLTIANATGAGIFAVEYGDSTRTTPGVLVSRVGVSGSKTSDWIANPSDNRASMATAFDMVTPDLSVVMLGSNDFFNNVPPATYASNLTTLIQRAQGKNSDVLLVVPPPPSGTQTYLASDYQQKVYEVADSLDCGVIDMLDRWGSYSTSNSAPYSMYADNAHPSAKGYVDVAQAVFDVLKNVA